MSEEDFSVLSTLTGMEVTSYSQVIQQGWRDTDPAVTGCLIKADIVFSICDGVVVDVGKDKDNLYSVSVEYDYQTWVRYCLLESCSVTVGSTIYEGDEIGKAYKNSFRFEYCTDEISDFSFRTETRQLYKHDPIEVLIGLILLPDIDETGEIYETDEEVPYEELDYVEEE